VEYCNELDAIQVKQSLHCVMVSLGDGFRLNLTDAWSS